MALVTDAVEIRYGARCAVRATSLALEPSGFVALVGPNGAERQQQRLASCEPEIEYEHRAKRRAARRAEQAGLGERVAQ